jgi:Tol biopolymer transport system component
MAKDNFSYSETDKESLCMEFMILQAVPGKGVAASRQSGRCRTRQQLTVSLLAIVLGSLVSSLGCGGGNMQPSTPPTQPTIIAFGSTRALDGSAAANANFTENIWAVKSDGTGATPLTKLTASNAFSFGAAWSPDGSKLAFLSVRALDGSDAPNTTFNIWVMKSDGTGATPLTKLTAAGAGPRTCAWSPDGTKIAFDSGGALDGSDAANAGTVSNIWVMNADGSGATPLTKLTAGGAHSSEPVWSRDGGKIAFTSRRALDGSNAANINFVANIWVMKADGSSAVTLTKLTASGALTFSPAWSPDGSKLAFQSERALDGSDAAGTNRTVNIWTMKADGSGATPLTKLTALKANSGIPVWSPDGSKIVFDSSRALDGSDAANTNFVSNIWVMGADGSATVPLTKLTAVNSDSFDPVWSRDGGKIAFDSQRAVDGTAAANPNFVSNIWVMNADGSGAVPLTKLTVASSDSGGPQWKP